MTVALIAAASDNNVIGNKGKLPWHLPDDMKFFRRMTQGHPMIMGRKTLESLPGLLPHREHIVVTRDQTYTYEGVEVSSSLDEALMFAARGNPATTVFVIGGGEIYAQALHVADIIYLTRVHAQVEGDVFFPEIDLQVWEEVERREHPADADHQYAYSFCTYKRRNRLQLKD